MANTRIIRFAGNGASFEIAVNPKDFTVTQGSGNKSISLLNVGEVVIAGYRGLIKTTITTFLPASSSPFYKGKNPEEIISRMKQWKNGKQPVRIIITGTDINTMFLIENMDEKYAEGQLDIMVNWSFVEYRVLNMPASATTAFVNNTTTEALKPRTGTNTVPKVVTVKTGDSLWGYAVRYYGSGSFWKVIADANHITNPDNITAGMRLEIPRL